MSVFEKLKTIAKAKFSDKSDLGDWYKNRLDICKECPLNSINKEKKSATETAMVLANLGQPTCLACGCEIAAKASVREEECGLAKLGQEPIWEALPSEHEEVEAGEVLIKSLDYNKVSIRYNKRLYIDYGTVKQGADTKINFELSSETGPISFITAAAGCGCTTSATKAENGVGTVSIEYDSKRLGNAKKTVAITYQIGTVKKNIIAEFSINVEK